MTQSLDQFIRSAGIKMRATRTDRNPAMSDANMDHWRCILRAGRSRMSLVFSMGYGHNGKEPKPAEVLDCLASDASGLENAQDFEDWCAEYGYDTDSRKAERIYKAIQRQAESLKRLLGDSAYETLLFNTERL
jgi:hypothetical protein